MNFEQNLKNQLKERNINDSSINLYLRNLKLLNNNKQLLNLNFLKNKEAIQKKLEEYSPKTQRNFIIAICAILKDRTKDNQTPLYKYYYDLLKKYNIDEF